MKLENQVCSLEQAKKLNELGVIQEGFFVYRHWRGNGNIILSKRSDKYNDYPKNRRQVAPCVLGCAFTVAELGEMLGEGYNSYCDDLYWCCDDGAEMPFKGQTEAIARAEMLIHLLTTCPEYIKETNERLKIT